MLLEEHQQTTVSLCLFILRLMRMIKLAHIYTLESNNIFYLFSSSCQLEGEIVTNSLLSQIVQTLNNRFEETGRGPIEYPGQIVRGGINIFFCEISSFRLCAKRISNADRICFFLLVLTCK